MTTDLQRTENDAHELIGRLFTAAEPPYRDMAEASIAHGTAALRRQRGLMVGGAVLSVVAVTAAAVSFGGHSTVPGGGKGGATVTAGGADAPTSADKQRELNAELPRLLAPLLPDGMTLVAGKASLPGAFLLQSADTTKRQEVEIGIGSDSTVGSEKDGSVTQVSAPGGRVRVEDGLSGVVPGSPPSEKGARYTFVFDDRSLPVVMVFLLHSDAPLLTPQDFAKLVTAPGFAPVRALLDPAVPASSEVVALRKETERRIAERLRDILPAGYRLQLSQNWPGEYDLVGPQGLTSFAWSAEKLHELDFTQESKCGNLPAAQACSVTDVPGGKLMYQTGGAPDVSGTGDVRLGVYEYQAAAPDGPTVTLKIFRDTGNTATAGPGLSVAQVLKIAQSPDIVAAVAGVAALANG